MKKTGTFLFTLLFLSAAYAQNVGIGNTTPNIHSILDLRNGGSRALLLPWATLDARNTLTSLPSGGLIYQNSGTTEEPTGLYFKSGSVWKYLMTSTDIKKTWDLSANGSSQTSTTERVGIGTGTDNISAGMHIRRTNGELVSIRMQGQFPSLSFDYGAEGQGYTTKALIYGTDYGLMFSAGATSPGTSMRFRLGDADRIILESDGTFRTRSEFRLTDPTLTDKAFLQMSGDNFRLGTVASNITGNVILRMGGNDRFNFANYGRMSIMADANPTISFYAGGVQQAFLQEQSGNLRISAGGGKVNLADDLTVDGATSRVGIGTTSPEQKLHVAGTAKVGSGKVLNSNNENLLPYGYAIFNTSGTRVRGTTSLTGSWTGNDFYLEATDGTDISDGILSITCYNARVIPSFIASGTRLRISFFDDGGTQYKVSFSAVLYKTN